MTERRFVVVDGEGDAIRTFLTRNDAKFFMRNRPETTLKEIPKGEEPDAFTKLLNELDAALF